MCALLDSSDLMLALSYAWFTFAEGRIVSKLRPGREAFHVDETQNSTFRSALLLLVPVLPCLIYESSPAAGWRKERSIRWRVWQPGKNKDRCIAV